MNNLQNHGHEHTYLTLLPKELIYELTKFYGFKQGFDLSENFEYKYLSRYANGIGFKKYIADRLKRMVQELHGNYILCNEQAFRLFITSLANILNIKDITLYSLVDSPYSFPLLKRALNDGSSQFNYDLSAIEFTLEALLLQKNHNLKTQLLLFNYYKERTQGRNELTIRVSEFMRHLKAIGFRFNCVYALPFILYSNKAVQLMIGQTNNILRYSAIVGALLYIYHLST